MEEEIVTQTIPVSQARQKLGELINEVYKRKVRLIIEKSGIPAVALVSLSDLERWSRQDREQQKGGGAAPEARAEAETKETSPTPVPPIEQLARRQALVARILANAEARIISPLSTEDLVHQARKDREKAYERWSR